MTGRLMRSLRIVGSACLLLVFWTGVPGNSWAPPRAPAWAADAPDRQRERARITALLDAVEHSGAKFVREGKEYSAVQGRKHLARKLRHAGERVKTAEDFIESIASRSSTTGRPYFVRLVNGEKMESGAWMRQRLAEIDGRR